MFEFWVSGLHHNLSGSGVYLESPRSRSQGSGPSFDGAYHRAESSLHIGRRRGLACPPHVPHALEVRAVAVTADTDVDVDQMPRERYESLPMGTYVRDRTTGRN